MKIKVRRLTVIISLILCTIPVAVFSAGNDDRIPVSVEELWEDFDPRGIPLEIDIIREWTENGSRWKEFYFTGEIWEGSSVRIYAMYAEPEGARNLPGMLHIHGGGQTVNTDWLRYWNERGYSAMTFNWGGEWPDRERYALWGKLEQGNHRQSNHMTTLPNPKANSWYHWILVSRRALTFLEQQPGVDPERLGIFGISMGGTIVWNLAGIDDRVKAACAIYGAGWNSYSKDTAVPDHNADNPNYRAWRRLLAPEAYAHRATCPILFLDASTDQHGNMDYAYRTLEDVPTETRQVFTPRFRHHIEPEDAATLPLFMDWWLKDGSPLPETPAITLALDSTGNPVARVVPDRPSEVERVAIYYGVENTLPPTRSLRSPNVTSTGDEWTASMTVSDVDAPIYAFANVYYSSGAALTSQLVKRIPSALGNAAAHDVPSMILGDFRDGWDSWFYVPAYTDPTRTDTYLHTTTGPDGVPAITINPDLMGNRLRIATHRIGDPKWRGHGDVSLRIMALADEGNQLEIALLTTEMVPGAITYKAVVPLVGSPGWQEIVLSRDSFTSSDGTVLPTWETLCKLEIALHQPDRSNSVSWQGAPPLFAEIGWIE